MGVGSPPTFGGIHLADLFASQENAQCLLIFTMSVVIHLWVWMATIAKHAAPCTPSQLDFPDPSQGERVWGCRCESWQPPQSLRGMATSWPLFNGVMVQDLDYALHFCEVLQHLTLLSKSQGLC